ncbi:hypothetical protein M0805_004248 [Coniferiporia weirii]|nr:hypothetical protein M0805_004248 [Coniferiporia weirii]
MHPHGNPSRTQQVVHALNSALSNPYGQSQQHSSHYARAYAQHPGGMSTTTPEGYTLSSTYVPTPAAQHQQPNAARGLRRGNQRGVQSSRGGRGGPYTQVQTHWYEPGNHRCTHEQCAFTGSKKSVETHMMDRHLIFPPGWDKRKRKPDWDADPSLNNGKPIPIQGTSFVLNTPEDITAWITERKNRWPTAERAKEKNIKLQEAITRGEIAVSDPGLRGIKRPRADDGIRGRDRPEGRGRGGARGGGHTRSFTTIHPLPKKPVSFVQAEVVKLDDEDSSSGSDMDGDRDAIPSKPTVTKRATVEDSDQFRSTELSRAPEHLDPKQSESSEIRKTQRLPQQIQPVFRKPASQPKVPPRNLFSNRHSLLRNLLLPEIRMTVSNLSQAVHFLVENNFLEDVELNPGDADNNPIEVIAKDDHGFV